MSCQRLRQSVALLLCVSAIHFSSVCLHAQLTAKLAASVQPFVDRQELAGAVMLVADKDKVLAVEAVGWADIAAQKPMQTDSMFWIASQSKPITAAALMMLVDEGKVNVSGPVENYLPELMTPPTKGVDACRACATPEPVVFFHVTHGSKSVTKDSQILETSL